MGECWGIATALFESGARSLIGVQLVRASVLGAAVVFRAFVVSSNVDKPDFVVLVHGSCGCSHAACLCASTHTHTHLMCFVSLGMVTLAKGAL